METTGEYGRLLAAMEEKYQELTGFDSDAASDIGIRFRVLAGELASLYGSLEDLRQQIFPQTSTGDNLEQHAKLRGILRKSAQPAQGVLRFSREVPSSADIPIAAGVVCATRPAPQVQYATTVAGRLPAGELSVEIPAAAMDLGGQGNVAGGAVCLLVSAVPGITAVTNPAPFTGGVDGESDEQLRHRLLTSHRSIANGTNCAYYYHIAMGNPNVTSAGVIPRARGRGTVDVVVACTSRRVESSTVAALQAELSRNREIGVDVRVAAARELSLDVRAYIQVEEAYDFVEVSHQCTAVIGDYLATMGVDKPLTIACLGAMLMEVEGVINQKIVLPATDVIIDPDQILRRGNVNVRNLVAQ